MDNHNKTNNGDLEKNIHELEDKDMDKSDKNQTNYLGVFLPIGTALGVSFGIIFDNLAIGISIGTALGVLMGTIVQSTKTEK
ncbi:hypothetical protein NSA47_14355 [Irregularibacter muris]|uniref:Glycine zipper-like domain-containing protein n=1 Tax=Irregularibacter muris TaxID=1796619 RepID=A0AAE3HH93_9FIRM|nr:hypothetical protein [Irregularibacter muris]MCR1900146.1 hypothetical protein [Irregularibacter muris]